jgi:hypothetical protein
MTVKGLKTQTLQTADNVSGLVLLNTTSFSGVTSQSINDVFSTTYQNYKVLVNIDTVASSDEVNLRLRVSGSDNTSANYKWQKASFGTSGALSGQGTGTGALGTYINAGSISGTYTSFFTMEFFNPFATDNTGVIAQSSYFDALANHGTTYAGGLMSVTTSYTGFTFYSTSNMNGTVRVYGYNN